MKLQKLTKAWFDFPDDSDQSSFEIEHLRAGEIADIVEKTHKQRFEFREAENGELKPIPIFEADKKAERELTVIAAISDWKNIFDENGLPLPCTDENKKRLCRELGEEDYKVFLSFILIAGKNFLKRLKNRSKRKKKLN